MKQLLIVEDDAENNQMLREYLEGHGYGCTQAFSGSEARLLFSMREFDLILLDLMLPGISGEELVPLFSEKCPVIILSAKSGLDSKVDLLSAGADDYLCKPFELQELLVRIQVQLRRRKKEPSGNSLPASEAESAGTSRLAEAAGTFLPASGPESAGTDRQAEAAGAEPEFTVYRYREWCLNPDTMELTAASRPVSLTKHEFLILELLIRNPKRVFSKQMIYEYAWGQEYLAEDKTLNVHISNIRAKLKESGTDSYIQTVWGMGFRLV